MAKFVIYHRGTTVILGGWNQTYATEAAAKGALTKAVNAGEIQRDDYTISEKTVFHKTIEKKQEVENLLSGAKVMEPVNTPNFCSVGSEAYWSM